MINSRQILDKIHEYKQLPFGTTNITCNFNELNYQLILITKDCIKKKTITKLLAWWRKKHEKWFPSQFKITLKGTTKWLKEKVIEMPDRLLFLIKVKGEYIGHIGLFRFDFDNFSCEIDNIVRGVNIYSGIMTNAIQYMMDWGKKELELKKYTLETTSDNEKAITLYNRLGFSIFKKIPLIYVKKNGGGEWIVAPIDYKEKIVRYNVFMSQ